MRLITTTKCSILYADVDGTEVRLQNKQGETLYTVEREHFERVYEIIGKEETDVRARDEEGTCI